MDRQEFDTALSDFVRRSMTEAGHASPDIALLGSDNVVEKGYVDSFALIELIDLLESLSGKEVDVMALNPDAFFTPDAMYKFVSE